MDTSEKRFITIAILTILAAGIFFVSNDIYNGLVVLYDNLVAFSIIFGGVGAIIIVIIITIILIVIIRMLTKVVD